MGGKLPDPEVIVSRAYGQSPFSVLRNSDIICCLRIK